MPEWPHKPLYVGPIPTPATNKKGVVLRVDRRHTPHSQFVRRNIVRMRRNNPCATLREIGDKFNISRERARQILKEAGAPTAAFIQPYFCLQCGRDMGRTYHLFCSSECLHNYTHTLIPCSYCGNPTREINIKWLNWQIDHGRHSPDLFFCSKICQGKWLAENHGFVKYPENRGAPRKWDWSKVCELRDRTGWGARRISWALGMPEGTVSVILSKRQRN